MTDARKNLNKALLMRDKIQALSLNLVDSDPWVLIKLGPTTYRLEYNYDAVVEVFRSTGIVLNLTNIMMGHLGDPNVFPALLEAGLRTHHGDLLMELERQGKKLTSLVPMRHLQYVHTCMMLALQAAEPEPADVQRVLEEVEEQYQEDKQVELPLEDAPSSDASGQGAPTLEFPTLR
jgi:hypothetical protein